MAETKTGLQCPDCKADEGECLHQRLKSYRGRPEIYKCHRCNVIFTEPLDELLRRNGIDRRLGG